MVQTPIINAGKAAFSPIMVPTITFVNGISNTIRIINGMERKILTIAPITLVNQFIFPYISF